LFVSCSNTRGTYAEIIYNKNNDTVDIFPCSRSLVEYQKLLTEQENKKKQGQAQAQAQTHQKPKPQSMPPQAKHGTNTPGEKSQQQSGKQVEPKHSSPHKDMSNNNNNNNNKNNHNNKSTHQKKEGLGKVINFYKLKACPNCVFPVCTIIESPVTSSAVHGSDGQTLSNKGLAEDERRRAESQLTALIKTTPQQQFNMLNLKVHLPQRLTST